MLNALQVNSSGEGDEPYRCLGEALKKSFPVLMSGKTESEPVQEGTGLPA